MKRTLVLACLLLSACAGSQGGTPSLAPRAAEAIDPRLPVPDRSAAVPADSNLQQRLRASVRSASGAADAAERAIAAAERAAGTAGAPESESWIAAQQLLSAAIAARYPVTRALGDLDAATAAAVRERGGLAAADAGEVQQASAALGEIDARQAARIAAVQARLEAR